MTENACEKKKQISAVYEEKFLAENPELADGDEQWCFLARYLPENHEASVLDAGCGNGKYTRAIIQQGYRNTMAIDLLNTVEDLPNYTCSSIVETPFQDASYDFICSLSVIFYLDNPAEAFDEFFRLLKPDGKVIVSCHTRYSFFTLERLFKRWLGLRSAEHLKHVQFLSATQYRRMMEAAGLEVLEIDGFRVSYFRTQIRRVLRRLGWSTTTPQLGKSRRPFMGLLRATFGYHSILVGQKQATGSEICYEKQVA